jgi:putative ABC transport system permease protein
MRPLSGDSWSQDITLEGGPVLLRGDLMWAAHRSVSIGYFRAMGIPLLSGRSFAPDDERMDVAIVSESMAKRYWPGQDVLGKRFGVNCARQWPKCDWNTIVGVVGDVKEMGAAAEPAAAMYFPEIAGAMTLVIRSSQDSATLAATVRQIVKSIDPSQPLADVGTMEGVLAESLAPRRLTLAVAVLFAALALLLAAVGIYGVISYSVAQRLHELGIRMALGAARDDIMKLVVGEGLRLALVGAGAGVLAALALTRLMSSMLFRIRGTDPATFMVVAFLVTCTAVLASLIPAHRATKVDPMVALRHQ